MKFHGLMVVRDEADILPETISHLLQWIDGLYVLDLGSTDSSWQLLQDLASKDPRIFLYGSKPFIFHDSLRSMLFDAYRHHFKNGDWILRTDADEFYHDPPPDFIRRHLRAGETCVHLLWYYFRLTSLEVDSYQTGQIEIERDRQRPIAERRRFYKIPDYAEPRMFQYRTTMQWPENASFPFNAGYVARKRIPIRHYPHRDPRQMARRYQLRAAMKALKAEAGPHWALEDWRQDVLQVNTASGDALEQNQAGVGLAAATGHVAGKLHYWTSGEALPEVHSTRHLAPVPKRCLQRLIHPLCLPVLDRLRPRFPKNFRPDLIPDAITQQLREPVPKPFETNT